MDKIVWKWCLIALFSIHWNEWWYNKCCYHTFEFSPDSVPFCKIPIPMWELVSNGTENHSQFLFLSILYWDRWSKPRNYFNNSNIMRMCWLFHRFCACVVCNVKFYSLYNPLHDIFIQSPFMCVLGNVQFPVNTLSLVKAYDHMYKRHYEVWIHLLL